MVNLRAKCIVCGDSTVGKTALIQSFQSDGTQYPKNYLMTTGVELLVKHIPIPETMDTVEMFLYDFAGKDIFFEQVNQHLDEAALLMVVYDVTNEQSFQSCQKWIKNVRNVNPDQKMPCVLVANKVDLHERRLITAEQGKELAKAESMEYFEASAKELKDIETPFLHLALLFRGMYEDKIEGLNQET